MPSSTVIKVFMRELLSKRSAERKNEPDLIMDDPEKVTAYTRAGREDGVMQPVYLYHCAQICEVIKPGDTVVDLGCGPGTQLALVARLNPEVNFIGVDLSNEMLDRARAHIKTLNLSNVELRQEDITQLQSFSDNSIDAFMSTVVLHHLPNITALENTFSQISRILKSGGGLYIVDFGHLKSEKSIHDFAYQYVDRQAELFTLDYLYSLQAAFWPEDFEKLHQKYLNSAGKFYKPLIMPYMMAIKSPARRELNSKLKQQLQNIRQSMPTHHKTDITDLIRLFHLGGGLKCRSLK
ncbi:MAG: class I SAM-dependent methyltransferase [Methyloprofundus sp.]|nr:class I SAM-dependent methyltransferase [Methyloprofundus sp.]